MNRRVLLIAVVAAAAVVGIWYVALWSPANRDLAAAHQRSDAAAQQSADLGIKVRALTAARKDMPVKQAELDRLRAAVPDAPQLDQMIATINAAAIASGVELSSLSPQQPSTGTATAGAATAPKIAGAPTELNITMQIGGMYPQVIDFMNRLNASPRLVLLDTVSVAGGADKTGKIATSLNAKMFVDTTGGK